MIYLSSFKLSEREVTNPHIYPYNVFRGKYIDPFVFSPITVLYGNNGSGKSTILNIIANKLNLKGKEYATGNSFGSVDYCEAFSEECSFSYGEDECGRTFREIPPNSRYIKSEDILYNIKKVQQRQVLSEGMLYGLRCSILMNICCRMYFICWMSRRYHCLRQIRSGWQKK